ncbi:hypothetical protein ACJRO7_019619 [Eucalyptus globulus]|uniref:Neprosin PEP catalytic domain-containing protein n=1 Tax=Eucalyptus globulus TaxID=34317 RepID=A0ABD3KGY3_EUCGL
MDSSPEQQLLFHARASTKTHCLDQPRSITGAPTSTSDHTWCLVRIARMESKLVLLLLFSLLCRQVKSSSLEEDLQIEEKLRRLNKPAVKTIQTEYGDSYDCVDFHKQPAFDHPLLKNHSFHFNMRPSSRPKRSTNLERSSASGVKSASIKRLDCPIGTVPIRRTSKEELIAAKMQAKVLALNADPNTQESPGNHFAVVRTKFDSGRRYDGGGMISTVEKPPCQGSQYTGGRIKISSLAEYIQAGWIVNPSLYSDDQTHLFILTGASCFNTQCGFVLVCADHPVDAVLQPVSQNPKPVYTYNFFIYRDPLSGSWWLELGEDYSPVGFWPKALFAERGFPHVGLRDLATHVEWGGLVYSPLDIPSPPMGRATEPHDEASCWDMTTINGNHETEAAGDTETYVDQDKYYGVEDLGHQDAPLHRAMKYGGAGGATGA